MNKHMEELTYEGWLETAPYTITNMRQRLEACDIFLSRDDLKDEVLKKIYTAEREHLIALL